MRHVTSLLCALLATGSAAIGETYVVDPEGTGDFRTIQEAIDAVLDGDTAVLADGVFTGEGNRDIDYLGKAITVRSQSGDPFTCIIDCEGSAAHPHRGFFFHTQESQESVLQAVTVRNGYAANFSVSDRGGGAVRCYDASPLIKDCCFAANTSPQYGGGVSAAMMSRVAIVGCVFSENTAAKRGGGAFFDLSCNPTLEECSFVGNAAIEGGGICMHALHGTLVDCTFAENSAEKGGGFLCYDGSSPTITSCVFSGNSAHDGGAMFITFWETYPILTGCILAGNEATHCGGAIYIMNEAAPILSGCTLHGNAAPQGCGMYLYYLCDPTIENTILAFGEGGEAVACELYSNPAFACSDIYGNEGGDWVGCIADQGSIHENFSADPCFCDPQGGDFQLGEASPCDHPVCGIVGALPVGCQIPQSVESPPGAGAAATSVHLTASPNPCTRATDIWFSTPVAGQVASRLAIYNVTGRLIRSLGCFDGSSQDRRISWDATDAHGRLVAPGVYFIELTVGKQATRDRLLVVR